MLAILVLAWPSKYETASTSAAPNIYSKTATPKIPVKKTPGPQGAPQWIEGRATVMGDSGVVVKTGYQFYVIKFADKDAVKGVQDAKNVRVLALPLGWDEEVGAFIMAGVKVGGGGSG